MTEVEWLASNDPAKMLEWCQGNRHAGNPQLWESHYKISDRKLRLFAVACCRAVWNLLTDDAPCGRCDGHWLEQCGRSSIYDHAKGEWVVCPDCDGSGRVNRSRRAVEVASRFADGEATEGELRQAFDSSFAALQSQPGNAFAAAAHGCCYEAGSLERVPRQIAVGFPDQALARPPQAALLREVVGNPFAPVPVRRPLPWIVTNLAHAAYDERLPSGVLDSVRLAVLADAVEEETPWTDRRVLEHLRSAGDHVRGCWCLDLLLGSD